jgi:hypothetical protein
MIGDRIEQTTPGGGTNVTITLDPPPAGRLAFTDMIPPGTLAYYTIEYNDEWEEGIGPVLAGQLSRQEIIRSSAGTSRISIDGPAVVRCAPIAEWFGGMGGRLHMARSVSNTGTTYIVSCVPAVRALADGVRVRFRANVTNTQGGASADVDSTGAKPIRKGDFAPVEPYELRLGDIYEIVYDATAECWQLQSPVFNRGPTVLINGDFRIAQRGTSFAGIANNQYLLDRWRYSVGAGGGTPATVNASRQAFTLGQSEVPGEPVNYLRIAPQDVGANLGAASFAVVSQRIEDVRSIAPGRWASRVWMRSSIAGKRVGFRLRRFFGSGGSADQSVATAESHALSTVWQPFDIFWTVPTLSGLTVGGGSFLDLQIWLQWGTNFDADFGTSGGEGWGAAGTIDIADAKFEPGHLVTPFERRNVAVDWALCQRYFERIGDGTNSNVPAASGYADIVGATYVCVASGQFAVEKRVPPVMSRVGTFSVNRVNQPQGHATTQSWTIFAASNDTGRTFFNPQAGAYFTADAEI